MKNINKLALAGIILAGFAAPLAHAEEMAKPDAMMMKPSDDKMMMEKSDKMTMKKDGMMMSDMQMKFSKEAFMMAEKSGKPFLVAFHKKGCSLCAAQQEALNTVYKDPMAKDLKVLVVDYDNDTMNLKKFNVGEQGTLILYKGDKEMSRTTGSKDAATIMDQIEM